MAKEIRTTKRVPFYELAKHLFCVDCKKRRPRCSPIIIQFGDTWNEDTDKVKTSITCKLEPETETKKAAKRRKSS